MIHSPVSHSQCPQVLFNVVNPHDLSTTCRTSGSLRNNPITARRSVYVMLLPGSRIARSRLLINRSSIEISFSQVCPGACPVLLLGLKPHAQPRIYTKANSKAYSKATFTLPPACDVWHIHFISWKRLSSNF